MCTNCFGKHQKTSCQSRKLSWPEYMNKFMSLNPEVNVDLIERPRPLATSRPIIDGSSESVSRSSPPVIQESCRVLDPVNSILDLESMDTSSSTTFSGEWQSNVDNTQLTVMTRADPSTTDVNKTKPSKISFLVPKNKAEHNLMIEKMIKAGTLPHEAEKVIALRKSAFAKASLEFKMINPKELNLSRRKQNQQSKLANTKADNHGL